MRNKKMLVGYVIKDWEKHFIRDDEQFNLRLPIISKLPATEVDEVKVWITIEEVH